MVVLQSVGQRRLVVDASPEARSRGIRPGMSAAEARALYGNLRCLDHDPTGDRRVLEALGRWLVRFTPVVARGWDNEADDAPAVLLLDLTGCERLFGGIDRLVSLVRQTLSRFNLPALLAVAPTPGAAWALTMTAVQTPVIVNEHVLSTALVSLPVESLRLDPPTLDALHGLGLYCVGDVLALPRDQLTSRFGPLLLKRLDQLTGALPEPLTHLVHDPPVTAHRLFDEPIEALDDIWTIFERLLDTVVADLARRGRGARQLKLTCTPDRGWGRPMIVRTISLTRPHRDFKALKNLIRCETERIDCEHGFVRFQLDVPLHEPITEEQAALFEQRQTEEATAFDRLLDRLRARLGNDAVIRPTPMESYLPERAWRPAWEDETPAGMVATSPRPLTLFPTPIEVRVLCEPSDDRTGRPRQFAWQNRVHPLVHIVGPERIGGEWWRCHRHTRDYYDVEDDAGRRFWLFRVLHMREDETVFARWFLHGRFD